MAYFLERGYEGRSVLTTVSSRRLRIGRGTNAGLRFRDPAVGLEHALIEELEDGYRLSDLGSVTGTWLNGERVESAELSAGDEIGIGGFRLRVQMLEPGDPLFLAIEESESEGTTTERSAVTSHLGTMLASSADLLATAERFAREGDELDPQATMLVPPDEMPTLAKAGAVPPPSPESTSRAAVSVSGATTAARSAAAETARRARAAEPVPGVPKIDYARAYRLRLGKGLVTFLVCLAAAGAIYGAVSRGAGSVWSPGDLASDHPERIGEDCAACHRPFQGVTDAGCLESGCHARVGEHQTTVAAQPACVSCHLEHRGLEALRLWGGSERCTACHAELEVAGGESRFDLAITGFTDGSHPEFALSTELGRLRLDEAAARTSDARGITFPHAWHLDASKVREALECEGCHVTEGGLMEPVVFETHCQRCHNLNFDGRFPGSQAPHDAPEVVLRDLIGTYQLHPEVLRALTPQENRRLRLFRGLGRDEQLNQVARVNTEQLIKVRCSKCHGFASALETPPEEQRVEPVHLRERWLPHSVFRHGPHLEVMECLDCHTGAPESRVASDVLLPGIATCQECHRPPRPGEDPRAANLGGHACLECHGYHPEPAEARARVATHGAQKETVGK